MRTVALVVTLGLVGACSGRSERPPEPGFAPEKIVVPTSKGVVTGGAPALVPNPLAAHEGSFEIVPPQVTPVGVATTARIRIVPGEDFHINTEYPFVVSLATPDGVTVAKTRLEGGRNGVAGDAETMIEGELSIPITVTPTAHGEHTLSGTIQFGICKREACMQRAMPVSVTVIAS